MAATVASIAPGRLTVALGSGDHLSRAENESFGIPYLAGEARERQLASVARALRSYLSGDPVTIHDEFASIERLPVSPRPSSPPPVWVAGRSGGLIEIAAEFGDGWNGWGGTVSQFERDVSRLEKAAAAHRRWVEPTWAGAVVLAGSDDEALSKLGTRPADAYIVGGPETVAARLAGLAGAGARHLVLTFPDAGQPGVYELLAGDVIPVLRGL
jgi:alkanesulfonate monooxygenase SsuD/methylene tetrahydromethanopterin reductase-like flavin-dependent oxidoreductase (luciferase family)